MTPTHHGEAWPSGDYHALGYLWANLPQDARTRDGYNYPVLVGKIAAIFGRTPDAIRFVLNRLYDLDTGYAPGVEGARAVDRWHQLWKLNVDAAELLGKISLAERIATYIEENH